MSERGGEGCWLGSHLLSPCSCLFSRKTSCFNIIFVSFMLIYPDTDVTEEDTENTEEALIKSSGLCNERILCGCKCSTVQPQQTV